MLLAELVAASQAVAATRSRTAKVAALANCLRRLDAAERRAGIAWLSGTLPDGRLGIGYAAVRGVAAPPAARASLTVQEVGASLAGLAAASGPGARRRRGELLQLLLTRATAAEQQFLRRLLVQELRQGALEGIMADALAAAAGVDAAEMRRALMVAGSLAAVGAAALDGGVAALRGFRLTLFRPLLPMLAGTAPDVDAALQRTGTASVETKYDGARVQVHRSGGAVRVYTRNLREVSANLPNLVAAVAGLPVRAVILDGEVLALRADGRPRPFQVTMSRFGRGGAAGATGQNVEGGGRRDGTSGGTRTARTAAAGAAGEHADAPGATADEAGEHAGGAGKLPLQPFFFDCLHLDGDDLIDRPLGERLAALDRACPAALRVPRVITADPERAARHAAEVLAAGHEGVMIKALDSRYEAGRRGGGWIKVKPAHTLDLVVVAIEWGSGRRRGWLSNLHLAARDPERGGFAMVGKTFKGMTDDTLRWQTSRFLELETHRRGGVVYVRPEQVVEIAFDGIQSSSRYDSGMALRFARVKRYRTDKPAAEADTVAAMRALHRRAAGGGGGGAAG